MTRISPEVHAFMKAGATEPARRLRRAYHKHATLTDEQIAEAELAIGHVQVSKTENVMKVYVILRNDRPDRAFTFKDAAIEYCDHMTEHDETEARLSVKNKFDAPCDWQYYEVELDQHKPWSFLSNTTAKS
jgi:hypothetical protein